jgi:hypothetical protein
MCAAVADAEHCMSLQIQTAFAPDGLDHADTFIRDPPNVP